MKRAFILGFCACLLAGIPAVAQTDDEFPWLTERKILGVNNLEPIAATAGTDAYAFSRAVARVEVLDGYGFCTASRVSERLFLTNFHCGRPCDSIQFNMGYEKNVKEPSRQVFRCKQLLRKSETLDYALFEAEPFTPVGGVDNSDAYPVLTLWRGPVAVNQRLIVPSHPSGRMKEIDRSDECILTTIETFLTESGRTTLKHMCDTEGGSSGSPVLDRKTGYAVALHWGGRDNEFNMAIPMTLVLQDLQGHIEPSFFGQLTIRDGTEQVGY